MTENFIKLMPGTKQHMQETQRTPSRTNAQHLHVVRHFQTTENQRLRRKNPERSQSEKNTLPIEKQF